MKNSVSDSYLSIESEENDENVFEKGDNERNNGEDSDDSDFSNYSYNNEDHSMPGSVSSAWPQSYRLCSFLMLIVYFCLSIKYTSN